MHKPTVVFLALIFCSAAEGREFYRSNFEISAVHNTTQGSENLASAKGVLTVSSDAAFCEVVFRDRASLGCNLVAYPTTQVTVILPSEVLKSLDLPADILERFNLQSAKLYVGGYEGRFRRQVSQFHSDDLKESLHLKLNVSRLRRMK